MTERDDRINQLLKKLEEVLNRQESFSKEINELREQIISLTLSQVKDQFEEKKETKPEDFPSNLNLKNQDEMVPPISPSLQKNYAVPPPLAPEFKPTRPPKAKSDVEKYIGENISNKIGIAILIIGVGIGAKYSIEHQLISPLTRIILGYLVGLGLLGFGIKLKKGYRDYSAVLVSGAMAILYFITYSAYIFYGLMPQLAAFSLMVVFTVGTVFAAITYNRQIIAHIGLVGAYAVPFLLGERSGNIALLFSYMAILNLGILLIAIYKYWKSIYYSSFLLTWLIFITWYLTEYQETAHYTVYWIFDFLFFVTFYLIFIAYKLRRKEKFQFQDVMLILANSFIFYGLGYNVLNNPVDGENLLGLFTLCNAFIHLCVCAVIYWQKFADRNLFFLTAGLALVFVTIAIPVQLDGHWVTLLWAGEAALLFWIGRTKNVSFYEVISYVLMGLAFVSLVGDWLVLYNQYDPSVPESKITPFVNIIFLTDLLCIGAFTFIYKLNSNKKYLPEIANPKSLQPLLSFLVPVILLIVLYFSIRMEISNYWNQVYSDSFISLKQEGQDYGPSFWNADIRGWSTLSILDYSLLFFAVFLTFAVKKIKETGLILLCIGASIAVVIAFLTQGLYTLSNLRDSYLNQALTEYYTRSPMNIGLRYISYAFVGLLLYTLFRAIRQDTLSPYLSRLKVIFDLVFHTTVLWIASSELITWMKIMAFSQSNKLGLSILWGAYALLLIILGIWKGKKYLRIGAIVLFSVTLLKLVFYDLTHLDTIAKTIVLVSLGILLLIISFLYNKYQHLTADQVEKVEAKEK